MPVTQVTILSITPDDVHAVVLWQANDFATAANCYVALLEADLVDPARRLTRAGLVPDMAFQVDIPPTFLGELGLSSGGRFFCQCDADGILSPVQTFQTTEVNFYKPAGLAVAGVTP